MTECPYEHLYRQRTIASPIAFIGIGLHSGTRVAMRLLPASAGQGITFFRRGLPPQEGEFEARWDRVTSTELCTTLGNIYGHQVASVEHLLAALNALGVDNLRVELDGPEVPIMDGSALPFTTALLNAGIKPLQAPRDVIVIRRPVRLQHGDSFVELLPDKSPRITVSIDFDQRAIGRQAMSFCLTPTNFVREIASARTFGFAEQLWHLRRHSLARGGSVRNAILLKEGRVANLEGLRFSDEFARHKALDVIGDLALAGHAIIGHYRGYRPGHRLNVDLIRLLINDRRAWQRVPAIDLLSGRDHEPAGSAADLAVDREAQATTSRPYLGEAGGTPLRGTIKRMRRLFSDDRK